MSLFEPAVAVVLQHEGSALFVDDVNREYSKYGISLSFLRLVRPEATRADIDQLTAEAATEIYRRHWWERWKYDQINDQAAATKIFDLAVNMGAAAAHAAAQRAVVGSPLMVDGLFGPKTIAAINAENPAVYLRRLKAEAAQKYTRIAAMYPSKNKYLRGWLARAAS